MDPESATLRKTASSPSVARLDSSLYVGIKNGLARDELRAVAAQGSCVAFGTHSCEYRLGTKPDAIDSAMSIGVWSVLFVGLLTAVIFPVFDPLTLGDNHRSALYKYLSVNGYGEAALLLVLKISYSLKDAVGSILCFQARHVASTVVQRGKMQLEGDLAKT